MTKTNYFRASVVLAATTLATRLLALVPALATASFKAFLLSLTVESCAFVTLRLDERVYPGNIAWRIEERA